MASLNPMQNDVRTLFTINRLYAISALRITHVIVLNRDRRLEDQWSAWEPICRVYFGDSVIILRDKMTKILLVAVAIQSSVNIDTTY